MISPRTDREQLIAEVCHLQGLEEGLTLGLQQSIEIIKRLKQRGIKTLEQIEEKEKKEGK